MVSCSERQKSASKYAELDEYYDQARAQDPIRAVFGYAQFLGDLYSREEGGSRMTALRAERHLLRRSLCDGGTARELALLGIASSYLRSPADDVSKRARIDRRTMQCYSIAVAENPDDPIVRDRYMSGCINVFEHLSGRELDNRIPMDSEVPGRAKIAYGRAVNSVVNLLTTNDRDSQDLCIRKLAYLTRWKIDKQCELLIGARAVPQLAKLLREGTLRTKTIDFARKCLEQIASQGCAKEEIAHLLEAIR